MRAIRSAIAICCLVAACNPRRPLPPEPRPICPDVLPSEWTKYWLDNTCQAEPCDVQARQSSCDVELRAEGCAEELPPLSIAEDGAFVLGAGGELGECHLLEEPAGILEARCADRRCGFGLVEPSALDWEVITQPLEADDTFDPHPDRHDTLLGGKGVFHGRLAAMVLLDDRIVVAHHAPGTRTAERDCHEAGPSSFVFLALDTLDVIGTSTAPACTELLVAVGPSRFWAFAHGDPLTASEHAADGTLLQSAVIAQLEAPEAATLHFSQGEFRNGELFVSRSNISEDGPAQILVLDTSGTIVRSSGRKLVIRSFAFFGSDVIAIGDKGEGGIELVGARSLETLDAISVLAGRRRVSDDVAFLVYSEIFDRLIFGATGEFAAVWTLDDERFIRDATFFEFFAAPFALLEDPAHNDILVGLTGDPPGIGVAEDDPIGFEARIARFDPEHARFLQGSVVIGRGMVRTLLRGADGAIYALLPWSAHVAKITRR